jgi:hypothetical protein
MKRSRALPTIASAGLIAGILDITSAFVIAGIKGTGSIRMLQGIASGLLGQRSFEGGMATAGLGSRHSLPDRVYSGGGVLRRQPEIEFSDTARRSVGIALWNCGLHFHVLDRRAARVPDRTPFHVKRRHRCDHSHCFDRAADRAGGPPFFERTIR